MAAALLFGGCPHGAQTPRSHAPAWSLGPAVLGDAPIRGLALTGDGIIVADGDRVRRLSRDGAGAWTFAPNAATGPLAIAGDLAAISLSGSAIADGSGDGSSRVPGLTRGFRGEPGAAVIAVGAADGAPRWTVSVGATRWALIASLAADGDGFLVTGSFAGTLRIGDRTATAAGNGDGFVAALDHAGAVRWLVRVGGDGADAIAGAAALGDGRIAIAGTFSGAAELRDVSLAPLDVTSATADGFVAVLDAAQRPVWARVWGGSADDTCAGVAVLDGGAIAVAGTVRGDVDVAGRSLGARGLGDGLVAVFAADARVQGAWLVGGDDFDGIAALAADRDRILVAGWFTRAMPAARRGDHSLVAAGPDDLFLVAGTASGPDQARALHSPGDASISALASDSLGIAIAIHATDTLELARTRHRPGPSVWFRGW